MVRIFQRSQKSMRNNLKKIGLSDKEIEIYLAGLKSGPATVQKLAQTSKIKRPTVYVVLDRLKELGLVNQRIRGNKKLFEMAEPKKLLKFVEKEKEEIEEKEKDINKIISNLEAMAKKAEFATDVKVYEGFEAIAEILGEFARTKSPTYAISSGEYFSKISFKKFMVKVGDVRERFKNKIYLITDPHPAPVKIYLMEDPIREFRFLPKGMRLPSMLNICQDKVALISVQEPYSIIVVQNKTIAETIKFMFNIIWQSLEGKNIPLPEMIEEAKRYS